MQPVDGQVAFATWIVVRVGPAGQSAKDGQVGGAEKERVSEEQRVERASCGAPRISAASKGGN